MRLVFCGTPDFALPSLRALLASRHRVLAAITQPDRPKGRGRLPQAPPVKELAREAGLEVRQPESLKDPDFLAWLEGLAPEALVVVAYGRILPRALLELPSRGCINLHASLLPRYRGAAPIHWAIINGERETGVTTMFVTPELDAGDIILQEAVEIGARETAGQLHDRLAVLGAELLVKTLDLLGEGRAPRRPQDPASATYAPPLRPEDERIDWTRPALAVYNRVRGLNPWPGAYGQWRERRVKIWWVDPPEPLEAEGLEPGQIAAVGEQGIKVACGDGQAVAIRRLQPEGKAVMGAADFIRGYRPQVGEAWA
ncbi:MAG: methionyl-tRNA formyltransferase [Clostridia bacterium]|jgi:methionyl-tRNA formyltransferase|nr:methionyl-tRNA formyltransferase [Clostridia bacterium]MDH7573298.1 methionyl-tRNA formyltransferase [Clostridia bacterium]